MSPTTSGRGSAARKSAGGKTSGKTGDRATSTRVAKGKSGDRPGSGAATAPNGSPGSRAAASARRTSAVLRRQPTGLWVVLGVALALRLTWFAYARPAPTSDFDEYYRLAQSLLDHGAFGHPEPSGTRVPGYPFFLAIASLLGRSTTWLSLLNVLLSTAICALAYALALQLFRSQRLALAGAAVLAIYPTFVVYSPVLASEHLFSAMLLITLLAATRPARPTLRWSLLTGALAGLLMLTHGEGVFMLPVVVLVVGLTALVGRASWRLAVGAMAVAGLTAVLVITPWLARNSATFGSGAGLSTLSGVNFYYAYAPTGYGYVPLEQTPLAGLSQVEQSKEGWRIGMAELRRDPSKVVSVTWTGVQRLYAAPDYPVFWSTAAEPTPETPISQKPLGLVPEVTWLVNAGWALLLPIAMLSLLLVRRWPVALAPIGLVVLANLLAHSAVSLAIPRYRYSVDVLLCVVAGVVVATLLDASRRRSQPATV